MSDYRTTLAFFPAFLVVGNPVFVPEHLQGVTGIVIGLGMKIVEVTMPTVTVTVLSADCHIEYVPLLNELVRGELVEAFLVGVSFVDIDCGRDVRVDWDEWLGPKVIVGFGVQRPVLPRVGVNDMLLQEKPELCVQIRDEAPDVKLLLPVVRSPDVPTSNEYDVV
ncbi:hypothetical protein F5Y19DRAFT_470601 [Xylariaceae sp. FL1651]|nr:hypothetical protein F5Y19DRAFT_470601 [Xylariaceae sp. FL1651]